MPDKIFLRLLILYGIWSYGIIGTLADEEINESSDFHIRPKRVVSHLRGEDIPVEVSDAAYVVYIKELDRISCVGSILSPHAVITAASCAPKHPSHYKVVSSSVQTSAGITHDVSEIRRHIGDLNHENFDGVALLTVTNPSFVYNQYCQPIKLHLGPLLIGSFGKVHGWGYNVGGGNRGTTIEHKLRSIEVPVISHQSCVNRYRPRLELSVKNVCTFHPNRHCGHNDFGAGLVVDGYLAGVFLWSGSVGQINPEYPDVFISLQDPYYNRWIRSNLRTIDLQFQNSHRH